MCRRDFLYVICTSKRKLILCAYLRFGSQNFCFAQCKKKNDGIRNTVCVLAQQIYFEFWIYFPTTTTPSIVLSLSFHWIPYIFNILTQNTQFSTQKKEHRQTFIHKYYIITCHRRDQHFPRGILTLLFVINYLNINSLSLR